MMNSSQFLPGHQTCEVPSETRAGSWLSAAKQILLLYRSPRERVQWCVQVRVLYSSLQTILWFIQNRMILRVLALRAMFYCKLWAAFYDNTL